MHTCASQSAAPDGSWGHACHPADAHCTLSCPGPLHSPTMGSDLRALDQPGTGQAKQAPLLPWKTAPDASAFGPTQGGNFSAPAPARAPEAPGSSRLPLSY